MANLTKHTSKDLRAQFLDYFKKNAHTVVKSAPLLPKDDPTLLFVNAGMVPFKDVFTGKETRSYTRATSSQKCVRAGGKHNDLENVGRTARHHTFFEMLGNFSFGDYFKEDACKYAWKFLTEELKLDKSKLSVTVFGGEGDLPADTEAEKIWHEVVGVPKEQISRMGAEDNFWAMGDTGACGPCSEIHYLRDSVQDSSDSEGDKNLEVWNLVFMQYERHKDGSLTDLPAPCVDTGMGLERLCLVMNGLDSNYDTDLFRPLISEVEKLAGTKYLTSNSEQDVSMRVIADHARACSFLIADGILPSNEGRGYVVRRILRRAVRHGKRLGFENLFFDKICDKVISEYSDTYPELLETRELILKLIQNEEASFRKTLDRGLNLFEQASSNLKSGDKLDGKVVFKLYETYGFPVDLTQVLAEEKNLKIDWQAFKKANKAHEEASSGELGLKGVDNIYKELLEEFGTPEFLYSQDDKSVKISALLKDGEKVQTLSEGDIGEVLFDKTAFYGESGGQVGDTGEIFNSADNQNHNFRALVTDTQKPGGLIMSRVHMQSGKVSVGDSHITQTIDKSRRESIARHHSATHLLHSAMREILGKHVTQKGSLVTAKRLRFDYSHFEPLTIQQIEEIEDLVNSWILKNKKTKIKSLSFDEAKSEGAMALFGEKYGDKVRVVKMGKESVELCGGTHVKRTGDIGFFKITSEGPLASGIRRLEAVAGTVASSWVRKNTRLINKLAKNLNTPVKTLEDKVEQNIRELRDLKRSLDNLKAASHADKAKEQANRAKDIAGMQLISENLGDINSVGDLRNYADKLRDQLKSGIVVLGGKISANKCMLLVTVTKDLNNKFHAGKIVQELAQIVGGRGGGRPDFAQAGGPEVNKLDEALNSVEQMLLKAN